MATQKLTSVIIDLGKEGEASLLIQAIAEDGSTVKIEYIDDKQRKVKCSFIRLNNENMILHAKHVANTINLANK